MCIRDRPPTVLGFGLLLLFGKHGPLGKLLLKMGTTVIFSWTATVIASTVVAFPLMYQTARGAFEQIEPNIERAARTPVSYTHLSTRAAQKQGEEKMVATILADRAERYFSTALI